MGINGFHQSTKHLLQKRHVSAFEGQRMCVDASGWLIRGGVGSSRELYTDPSFTGKPWVDFALSMVTMLQHYGVTPVLVFDGARLDLKEDTSGERQQRRKDAWSVASALEESGDVEAAEKKWKQVFEVTPEMEDDLQAALDCNGVEYVISENEADQQMASLVLSGQCFGVFTEDSDLVAYGVPRIAFKLQWDGMCDFLDTDWEPEDLEDQKRKITVRLGPLSALQRAVVCTFSGNDYVSNPARGLGFKKVYSLLRRVSTWDEALDRLREVAELSAEYVDRAKRVFDVFSHAHRYSKTLRISRIILLRP